ncbi:MAG: heme o synthase [Sphingobacteriales bacterium]|jgi:protoheme IX farnesyltransferase|nr:heme o synthase [Sphingobacteriales bacterium]OJW01750.1 MAG: protoheme IX farnesyltransferase [Sphingobacteriales bacterium 44-61]
MNKIKDYLQLVKLSLSIMVVFSSVISYLLAPKVVEYEWVMIGLLFAGGMLVTGSANAINQVVEKDTDAMMKRTGKRPVAAGRMSVQEGWAFAIITGALGVFILGYYFNWLSAGLAAFSLFLYAFIYTPMKKVSSMAVLMGAVPGALPCLIGWAAGDDRLSLGGWVLFGIQFLWQFPHFWAIAWIAHSDYSTAGFKLLPAEKGPTKFTALQTVIYSLLLFPVTVMPYFVGICNYNDVVGMVSIGLIVLANIFMLTRSTTLYAKMDVSSARKVMFGSYLYLPVVLLALLMSKA